MKQPHIDNFKTELLRDGFASLISQGETRENALIHMIRAIRQSLSAIEGDFNLTFCLHQFKWPTPIDGRPGKAGYGCQLHARKIR